ncbi:MAG: hypothetical protein EOP22_11235 [Hyphomicrobiales bacterium]|nr:MAG: hypothetical protein EOP22_11235 [Hyphomicrobiales bacterium]
MNALDALSQAWKGWGEIAAGKAHAARNFTPTRNGLGIAIFWFVIALLLSTAVQSLAVGMPAVEQILLGLLAQGLTLAVLALAIAQSLRFLKIEQPLTALLVPIVYAMGLMFILAIPLTLAGPTFALLAVFGLAWLIYRAARVLADMRQGTAFAFALLCLMVLVVVPNALYMVILQPPSPA